MASKKLKISVFEIIWYTLCSLVALWGLTYIVLGLVAEYLDVPASKNVIAVASAAHAEIFGLGFFGWGLIILPIAAVAAIIVLCIYAKRVDRIFEKEQRNAARRAFAKKEENVVDAE